MIRFSCIVVISCLSLAGCNAHNRYANFNSPPLADSETAEVNDKAISRILDTKPQLPPGFRMAVYFKKQRHSWRPDVSDTVSWSKADQEILLNATDTWKESGAVSDIFIMSDALVEDDKLIYLRRAAAQHGADALMVVQGAWDVESHPNILATTYPLIIPAFIIPGTEAKCKYISHLAVWDVRNEFLYASIEEESIGATSYPVASGNPDKAIQEARMIAAKQLAGQISETEFHEGFFDYAFSNRHSELENRPE